MITRIRSGILCDDVRQEDNGKSLLIGVYGKEVIVKQKPAMISCNLQLAFDVDAETNLIELRMKALTERVEQLSLNAVRGYCTLTLALTIALTEPRTLSIQVRNPGEEWLEAGEWDLKFTDDAADAPPEIAEQIHLISEQLKALSLPGADETTETSQTQP